MNNLCKDKNILVINITKSCNMSCSFCLNRDCPKIDGAEWTPEAREKFKDFIYKTKFQTYSMTGGEPFLNKEVLNFVVGTIIERSIEGGWNPSIMINTNATLINDTDVNWLNGNDIGVCLSLQGMNNEEKSVVHLIEASPAGSKIIDTLKQINKRFVRRVVTRDDPHWANDAILLSHMFDCNINIGLDETTMHELTIDDFLTFDQEWTKVEKLNTGTHRIFVLQTKETGCHCTMNETDMSVLGEPSEKVLTPPDVIIRGCTGTFLRMGEDNYKLFRFIVSKHMPQKPIWDGKVFKLKLNSGE